MIGATVRYADNSGTTGPLVVAAGDNASRVTARELARTLGLPFQESVSPNRRQLIQTVSALALHDADGARLCVEFSAAELKRYRPGASGRDLLRRALGTLTYVVDATAGLGRDSVHLACLGYRVSAIERNTVVAALTQDGLARARSAGLLPPDNPGWRTGDARTILTTLNPRPQAVYLDPMFPGKRKPASATRKEMRLVRALVADDEDYLELYTVARACATDRVVVKRADKAPPLAPNPSASYAGKTVRYDVYRVNNTG